ncbi:MAG: alpha/beta fold hydrolase [Chloroflexi bacterium]|nr:alpha/beta fold hydrolase [Chloroflexota bacterium]
MRIIVRFTIIITLLSLALGVASAQPTDDCAVEPDIMTTESGVEFVRTPDACFENLPDWDYEPQYVEINGLRQAYVDVGTGESGETILLLHGQPSWSYLYRHMIPVLADAGHRVIAMDHLGFGRSDKPIDWEYYTYVDHVERLEVFIQELELAGITPFVQDWGSLIGLQVVGTNPDWFDRLVVGNGFLPTYPEGETLFGPPDNPELTRRLFHQAITSIPAQQEPLEREPLDIESVAEFDTEGNFFGLWIDYARNDERFRPEVIIESQTYFDLTPEEEAAYAAPFPSRVYMGGARAFPGLVNQLGGVTDSGWAGLGEFDKPFLTIWGDNDGGNLGDPAVQQLLIDHIPGSESWDHVRLEEASHFLQDDAGEEIARRMNEFIAQSPVEALNTRPIPAITQTQFMPLPEDLRDFRYCEVLAVSLDGMAVTVDVYNSMGQNDCPADQWASLDEAAIADMYELAMARLNGPRHWVINGIQGRGESLAGDVVDFNGIEMRWVAQINPTPGQVASMNTVSYNETEVARDTVYTYTAGSRVYELVSPDRDIYRMQSYSQQVDPTLTIDNLENLGERLDLPDGWNFQTSILEEDSFLSADGIAYVVTDELNNAYQLVTAETTANEMMTQSPM